MAVINGTPGSNILVGTANGDMINGYTPPPPGVAVVADGLYRPLFAESPAGDGRVFVASQGGVISIIDPANPNAPAQTFLDLSGVVTNNTEAGLLGFTFHPDFANAGTVGYGKVYVNYTTQEIAEEPNDPNTGRKQAIVEYTFNPENLAAGPTGAPKPIMTIDDYTDQHAHHRGGWIGFGPDGMLYIATGDNTLQANSQTVRDSDGSPNYLGKILRINVNADGFQNDPTKNYAIPAGNPMTFQGIEDANGNPTTFPASEIWAIGLRNPWRCSFGPDGKLYIADVGQNTFEEINIGEAGANYGWGGTAPDDGNPNTPPVILGDGPHNLENYTDPFYHYARSEGQSVTGGYFYQGPGELNGKYLFADFVFGKIFAMDVSGPTPQVTDITPLFKDANGDQIDFGLISSFGRDGLGNLFVISYANGGGGNDTGKVFRLNPVYANTTDLGDFIAGGAGDDTIFGGGGDDTLQGGSENDRVNGEEGNDQLWGGAGQDTLAGGVGNDTYMADGSADTIVEGAGQGSDTVEVTGAAFTLANDVSVETIRTFDETLATAVGLTGNNLAQTIIGNAGANVINGGGGADTMSGLGGDDVYTVDSVDDQVIEVDNGGRDTVLASANYILGIDAAVEILATTGAGGDSAITLTGNEFAQTITGNNGANVLSGLGGNDTLEGGAGNDQLLGGAGNDLLTGGAGQDNLLGGNGDDTYVVDGTADIISELADQGTDTIKVTGTSYTLASGLSVEAITASSLTSTAALNLRGNELAQTLTGNAGVNVLDGGGGQDTLAGGAGNDVYYVDTLQERVVEALNGGTDTVYSSAATFNLLNGSPDASIEVLRTTHVSGSLVGNNFGQTLVGNSGTNDLSGSGGNDTLIGDRGQDEMSGGTGADTFLFRNVFETSTTASRADVIDDFSAREGDKINLSAIDANESASGNQAFAFIGTAAFTKAGQVRYAKSGGDTYVYLNTDADRSAEAVIRLEDSLTMQKAWFVL